MLVEVELIDELIGEVLIVFVSEFGLGFCILVFKYYYGSVL